MDNPLPTNRGAALGVEIIDEIGVARIAKTLGMSQQGVRKWRKGIIPQKHHDTLRELLDDSPPKVAQLPARSATSDKEVGKPAAQPGNRLAALVSTKPKKLEAITGDDAPGRMKAFIAARDVDHARAYVDYAASRAEGLPPVYPIRGYAVRLALLFALDFPILTMAFVAVIQASPIVAAGSAIALSLFLVLGAHALGGPLRDLSMSLPAWCRQLATVVILLTLLIMVIAVTVDLRIRGFDVEELFLNGAGSGGVFGDQAGNDLILPESFRWAIARAAGLVTVMATVFGISWSYQQHAPQADFARAEAAYRKALISYAHSIKRLPNVKSIAMATIVASLSGLVAIKPVHAVDCSGPQVLAFVDTTTAYDDQDRLVIMPVIDQMAGAVMPGFRLTIRTIRDSASSSRLLFDGCAPVSVDVDWSLSGLWQWLSTNPNDVRLARTKFNAGIRDALIPELQGTGDAQKTALIDTLVQFTSLSTRIDTIWLFTDLLESAAVRTSTLISVPGSLVETGKSLPPLNGVPVHVAGICRFHDQTRRPLTSREVGMLTDSWTALIQASGAELHIAN